MAFPAQTRSYNYGVVYNPYNGMYCYMPVTVPVNTVPVNTVPVNTALPAKPAQRPRAPSKSLNPKAIPTRSGRVENFQHRAQTKEKPQENEILRPYAYACRILFDKLVRASQGAFHNMPEDAKVNRVIGINLTDTIDFTDRAGIQHNYQVHTLLYGRRIPNEHYTHRENTFRKYHITSPFEAAQIFLLSKGIRLVNESDPTKGFALHLRVYKEEIPKSAPMWHRQNSLPHDIPLDVNLDTPEYDDITCVYLAPFRDAARYVNSTFEKDEIQDGDGETA